MACADVVKYLLEKTGGAESTVEVGNSEGRALLHVAALTNNKQLVCYLLDNHRASKSSVWTHKVGNFSFIGPLCSWSRGAMRLLCPRPLGGGSKR